MIPKNRAASCLSAASGHQCLWQIESAISLDTGSGQLAGRARHHMRPAHLHFIVIAPGHNVLATQIFYALDPYAYSGAAFGAVGSLLRSFEPDGAGGYTLDLELRVEPGPARVPRAPLP